MKLTREAYRRENATLRAQHQANVAVVAKALAEVRNLTHANERLQAELDAVPQHPALRENVRLAHHLEVAERELEQLRAAVAFQDARLAKFMSEHPDLFREAG